MLNKPNYTLSIKTAEELIAQNYILEPPVDIINIAINEGLKVLMAEFENNENNYISGYLDITKKEIYINSQDTTSRKIFTIAHELGHWLLHKDKIGFELDKFAILYRKSLGSPDNNYLEQEANCFAANLLVPMLLLESA